MLKYFYVTKNSLMEFLAYRLNFVLWRVRVVVSILITYFLWLAIYSGRDRIFNYTQGQMLTYIILLTFLSGVVLSTQTSRVAEEINSGNLSNYLIRPLNYLSFNLFRDLADKLINTFFAIIEMALILLIFRPHFILQTNPLNLFFFILSLIMAVILYFFISLLLSFIGFWSREVWAPRFIFFILVAFLAGTYFPLDIVPRPIYALFELLPFTYLIFFPLKIYLGNINGFFLIKGFAVSFFWLIILYQLVKIVGQKGLKAYTAEGK